MFYILGLNIITNEEETKINKDYCVGDKYIIYGIDEENNNYYEITMFIRKIKLYDYFTGNVVAFYKNQIKDMPEKIDYIAKEKLSLNCSIVDLDIDSGEDVFNIKEYVRLFGGMYKTYSKIIFNMKLFEENTIK